MLASIQSVSIALTLMKDRAGGRALVYNPGIGFILMTMLTLTAGAAFIMWLGEQINERGIGNGMSLIIFAGIVAGLPRAWGPRRGGSCDRAWGPFTGWRSCS